jgi:hypothetical protein
MAANYPLPPPAGGKDSKEITRLIGTEGADVGQTLLSRSCKEGRDELITLHQTQDILLKHYLTLSN